jgi:hypothetical protein
LILGLNNMHCPSRITSLLPHFLGIAGAWFLVFGPALPPLAHVNAEEPPLLTSPHVRQPVVHSTAPGVGHRHCCNRPEVFLLRGGAGYFPRASHFEDALRARGFQPRTIPHWGHRRVADDIASAYFAGELAGPVTIIGYSSGADAACWMCSRLNKAGVPVTNLVLIESTIGVAVPANVSFCYNIYESRWADAVPAFRGIAVAAKDPHTELLNVDVNRHPELAPLAERNHFTIASSRAMHSHISELLAQRTFRPSPALENESSVSGPGTPPVLEPGLAQFEPGDANPRR